MSFELEESVQWDSTLVVFLSKMIGTLDASGKKIVLNDLPEGLRSLLNMSGLSPTLSKINTRTASSIFPISNFLQVGSFPFGVSGYWLFLGWFAESRRCGGMILRRPLVRAGASALPIVTLISFLTGLTMAFVGSVQLEKFNAKIYRRRFGQLGHGARNGSLDGCDHHGGADGRELSAAEIGNMKLNEEIDSLRTFWDFSD